MPPAQTRLGNQPIDPQLGYGFREEPRPEYLQAFDKVAEVLSDPRNSWMAVGMPWLYHGTSATRAANILKKGFDPDMIGNIWGQTYGMLKGRSGLGAYFSEIPKFARDWGMMHSETPTILRAFIPEKNIKTFNRVTSPTARAELSNQAKELGYQAARFPDEVVVMDPTSIPLKNIRPYTGDPNVLTPLQIRRLLGYGD